MFKFKPPKRKRPLVDRSTRDGDDSNDHDDEGDPYPIGGNRNADISSSTTADAIQAVRQKRKDKKKKKRRKQTTTGAATLSFHMDEGDNDNGVDTDMDMGDGLDKKSRKRAKKSKQKKKRKGSGLGFGGGIQAADVGDEDDHDDSPEGRESGNNTGGSLYGKGELEKLKSEQKVYVTEEKGKTSDKLSEKVVNFGIEKGEAPKSKTETGVPVQGIVNGSAHGDAIPLPPASIKQVPKPPQQMQEDFISFNTGGKKSQPTIISGDDALKYTGEDANDDGIDREDLGTTVLSSNNATNDFNKQGEVFEGKVKMGENDESEDEEEGGRKWEEEIAKRAGVGVKPQSPSQQHLPGQIPLKDHALDNDHGKQVISQIKATIANSLENLKQRDLDLESDLRRREHEAEMALTEAKTKEKDMELIGKKFEYYQNLRSDVADWTGALRYLSEKIDTIEDALEGLYRDLGSKRLDRIIEFQDDNISVLKEYELLDYVVGRQPICLASSIGAKAEEPVVDEFGRDVRSMTSMNSNKRRTERKRRRAESRARRHRKSNGIDKYTVCSENDDSDVDISDHEILDIEERRYALGDAIQVVFDEMDEDFTSISSLFKLFQQWKDLYEDDYKQCYAHMVLTELIEVFARAESCKHLDLLGLLETQSIKTLEEFSWFDKCISSNLLIETQVDSLAQRMSQQVYRFTIDDLNNGTIWSYDPFSARQSCALSSFFKSILNRTSSVDEKTKIHDMILDYINGFVQKMAIAVTKKEALCKVVPEEDEKLLDAVAFATIGQLQSLRRLVINLVTFWYPTFDRPSKVAKFCLVDIMAYRFLPIFSSFDFPCDGKIAMQVKDVFISVWNIMKDSSWLDTNDLMIHSSPLRAAAVTIGIEQ